MANKKWVRIMFDYSSSGLWEENGLMMYPTNLPITQDLKDRIQKWVTLYDKHEWEAECISMKNDDESGLTSDELKRFDELEDLCKSYFKQGILLAVEVKAQLPDWTVKVYNNSYGILNLPEDENFNSEITSEFKFKGN